MSVELLHDHLSSGTCSTKDCGKLSISGVRSKSSRTDSVLKYLVSDTNKSYMLRKMNNHLVN